MRAGCPGVWLEMTNVYSQPSTQIGYIEKATMKTLDSPLKFMAYAILKAVRHPGTPITYFLCRCGCRFAPTSEPVCPKCGVSNYR